MVSDTFLSIFQDKCRSLLPVFKERVLPVEHIEHGILTSEGFAFCVLADLLEVGAILESGTGGGKSGLIWRKFFPGKPFVTVDQKLLSEIARERLLPSSQTIIITGDGSTLLPSLLEGGFKDQRVAVFIDGPKREASIDLAKRCYKFPNVVFVGVHDVHAFEVDAHLLKRGILNNVTRQRFDEWDVPKFLTDESWFVDLSASLDIVVPSKTGKYWKPNYYKNVPEFKSIKFGSYGYTIGFALKELYYSRIVS